MCKNFLIYEHNFSELSFSFFVFISYFCFRTVIAIANLVLFWFLVEICVLWYFSRNCLQVNLLVFPGDAVIFLRKASAGPPARTAACWGTNRLLKLLVRCFDVCLKSAGNTINLWCAHICFDVFSNPIFASKVRLTTVFLTSFPSELTSFSLFTSITRQN